MRVTLSPPEQADALLDWSASVKSCGAIGKEGMAHGEVCVNLLCMTGDGQPMQYDQMVSWEGHFPPMEGEDCLCQCDISGLSLKWATVHASSQDRWPSISPARVESRCARWWIARWRKMLRRPPAPRHPHSSPGRGRGDRVASGQKLPHIPGGYHGGKPSGNGRCFGKGPAGDDPLSALRDKHPQEE